MMFVVPLVYTVMRFTGSEIFRNPRTSVNEVAEQIKLLRQGKPISSAGHAWPMAAMSASDW
jgi:hypothetical protein